MENETSKPESNTSKFERSFYKITIIQTILAFVGIFTGCVALYAALNESDAVRKQQQAMVLPLVQVGVSDRDSISSAPMFRLTFLNAGIGPAIVRSVKREFDGKPLGSWTEFFAALGVDESSAEALSTSFIEHRIISAGENIHVVQYDGEDVEKFMSAFNENFERISLGLCYCSVFDDCWELDTDKIETMTRPQKVDGCSF